jgi:hypothetical protein
LGLVDCMVGLKLGVQAFLKRELYHGGAVDSRCRVATCSRRRLYRPVMDE